MISENPTSVMLDRAAGALVGLAAGDALGAGYEMTTPAVDAEITMIGGGLGNFAPGEWTDDTAQAVGIAEVTATGRVDLDAIGQRFLDWFAGSPPDCGVSTAAVLRASGGDPMRLSAASAAYFDRNPRGAAGNGALMRTAPVALAHLGDDAAIAEDAMRVAALTHGDPLAGEGCVVWCIAIDRAVREGRLDGVWDGVDVLPEGRRDDWASWLREAESVEPRSLRGNGFVVRALQAAWAAIRSTDGRADGEQPGHHLADGLRAAVRIGGDTDTVAAIAGQLLGARYGVSAVPAEWRLQLHGWPGLDVDDLVRLAVLTVRGGSADGAGWPVADVVPGVGSGFHVRLPADDGVLLGNAGGLEGAVAAGADAVVSLARVGRSQVPDNVEHLTVWLVDSAADCENPNLEQVLSDTVDQIVRWREQGRTVFVHCAAGESRTPTVAALYTARITDRSPVQAWRDLDAIMRTNHHNGRFQELLRHD